MAGDDPAEVRKRFAEVSFPSFHKLGAVLRVRRLGGKMARGRTSREDIVRKDGDGAKEEGPARPPSTNVAERVGAKEAACLIQRVHKGHAVRTELSRARYSHEVKEHGLKRLFVDVRGSFWRKASALFTMGSAFTRDHEDALRRRARDLDRVRKGLKTRFISPEVEDVKMRNKLDFRNQGDSSMYTSEALLRRRRCRANTAVDNEIERWWGRFNVLDSEHETMTLMEYCCMNIGLEFALDRGDLSDEELMRIACEDWIADAGGSYLVDRTLFFEAIFELCDIWCDSTDPSEYVTFLKVTGVALEDALRANHVRIRKIASQASDKLLKKEYGELTAGIKEDKDGLMRDSLGRVVQKRRDGQWYDEFGDLQYDENGRPVIYDGIGHHGERLEHSAYEALDNPPSLGLRFGDGRTVKGPCGIDLVRKVDGCLHDAFNALYDEDGNIIFDKDGYFVGGLTVGADGKLRDKNGRVLIRGADGCLYDEDGNMIYDANGNFVGNKNRGWNDGVHDAPWAPDFMKLGDGVFGFEGGDRGVLEREAYGTGLGSGIAGITRDGGGDGGFSARAGGKDRVIGWETVDTSYESHPYDDNPHSLDFIAREPRPPANRTADHLRGVRQPEAKLPEIVPRNRHPLYEAFDVERALSPDKGEVQTLEGFDFDIEAAIAQEGQKVDRPIAEDLRRGQPSPAPDRMAPSSRTNGVYEPPPLAVEDDLLLSRLRAQAANAEVARAARQGAKTQRGGKPPAKSSRHKKPKGKPSRRGHHGHGESSARLPSLVAGADKAGGMNSPPNEGKRVTHRVLSNSRPMKSEPGPDVAKKMAPPPRDMSRRDALPEIPLPKKKWPPALAVVTSAEGDVELPPIILY